MAIVRTPQYAARALLASFIFAGGIAHADNSALPDVSQEKSCSPGVLDTKYGQGGIALVTSANAGMTAEGIVMDDQDRVTVPFIFAPDSGGIDTFGLFRVDAKGVLDAKFGTGGQVAVGSVLNGVPSTTTMGRDPKGRMLLAVESNVSGYPVVGGVSTVTIYRIRPDGSPASDFGTNGAATFNLGTAFPIAGVTADADSRVLYATGSTNPASGNMEVTLVRLKEDGTPDTSFGNGGTAYAAIPGYAGPNRATDVLVQDDRKIIVLGRVLDTPSHLLFFATRFKENGTLDTNYGTNGFTAVDFGGMAEGRKGKLQQDGKLIFTGSVFDASSGIGSVGVVRLKTDGSPDTTFGVGGKAIYAVGQYGGAFFDIALQADGRAIVSGQQYLDAAQDSYISMLIRLKLDGSLDTTYAGSGIDVLNLGGYPIVAGGYVRINSQDVAVTSVSGASSATANGSSLLVGVKGDCN